MTRPIATDSNAPISERGIASRKRQRLAQLLGGFALGGVFGSAVTALAAAPHDLVALPEPAQQVRVWPKRALELEWRGYKTPVDADAMFRRRR